MQGAQQALQSSTTFRMIPQDVRQTIRKIDKSEMTNLRRMFLDHDKNGDGRLSHEEFKNMMIDQSNYTDEDIDIMISGMDIDGNGTIDFAEYLAMIVQEEDGTIAPADKSQLENLFQLLDKNGDGVVTKSELTTGMATIGVVINDSDLNQVWKSTQGKQGKLNKPELMKRLKDYGF